MSHTVRVLIGGLTLTDGYYYGEVGVVVVLTDEEYQHLDEIVFAEGFLQDLGQDSNPGTGESSYQHIQNTPATVWTVVHNLNRRPGVASIYSLDDSFQYDEFVAQHIDAASLLLSFDMPISGRAVVK